jgi:long-chain fatty acid transport protein
MNRNLFDQICIEHLNTIGQGRADMGASKGKSSQGEFNQVKSSQVKSSQVKSSQVKSSQVRLFAGAALASVAALSPLAAIDANAGAFGLRDQSATGEGDAFAGVAAGGALSSMFWNPATMTQIQGGGIEMNLTGILPDVTQNASGGAALLPLGGAASTVNAALLPSGYISRQISPNLWLGLAMNTPFGLSTNFNDPWAGRNYGLSSSISTYNANPSVAWRITDWLSVGVGAQIQYGRADVNLGLGAPPDIGHVNLDGHGWGFGATAGVTVTPGPNTSIGVGWRSGVNQKIDGTMNLSLPVPFSTPGSANTTLDLPDVVSVGARHRFDDHWTVMATAEWTNWSRIGTSLVSQANGGGAALIGGIPVALPFQYRDGWFYSVGAEYVLDSKMTLRGGVGYETSPITDQVRMPILPDNDRVWLSAGFSYKVLPNFITDVGFSHVFVKDSNINISATSGNPWFNPAVPLPYVGTASGSLNIISIGFRYLFDTPPPPLTKLVTKG